MYITDKIKKKISNSSKCVHHLPNDKVQHLFISCFESYALIVFNVIVLDKIRKKSSYLCDIEVQVWLH